MKICLTNIKMRDDIAHFLNTIKKLPSKILHFGLLTVSEECNMDDILDSEFQIVGVVHAQNVYDTMAFEATVGDKTVYFIEYYEDLSGTSLNAIIESIYNSKKVGN